VPGNALGSARPSPGSASQLSLRLYCERRQIPIVELKLAV
jgi:hypothetical protein